MDHWNHTLYGDMSVVDRNNSMGMIRYVLAIAVLVAHFNELFDSNYYFPISSYDAVGAFFALSGFLLYGNYLKDSSLKRYSIKRIRRVLPPYLFIIILCAFGLSIVSNISFKEYFAHTEFYKYLFYNSIFMNFMAPELPGVFMSSPISAVNASLWTMKVEIMLYCSVPIVAYISFACHRYFKLRTPLIVFIVIYILSMLYRLGFSIMYEHSGKEIYLIMGRQFLGQLMFFYSGVFVYFIYDRFTKHLKYVISVSLVLCMFGCSIPYYSITIGPLMISALTIALSSIKGIASIFNKNNISYDIYLFHFPVFQILSQYKQQLDMHYIVIFILGCGIIVSLSLLSWNLIENPILNKRF